MKNLVSTCEFGVLKESLIRDRIVFGIQDSSARERLPRDPKLTLETAIEQADKTTDESTSAINDEKPPRKRPSKFPMIDYKFCGRRHPRNKNFAKLIVQSATSDVFQVILQTSGEQRKQDNKKQANHSIW